MAVVALPPSLLLERVWESPWETPPRRRTLEAISKKLLRWRPNQGMHLRLLLRPVGQIIPLPPFPLLRPRPRPLRHCGEVKGGSGYGILVRGRGGEARVARDSTQAPFYRHPQLTVEFHHRHVGILVSCFISLLLHMLPFLKKIESTGLLQH